MKTILILLSAIILFGCSKKNDDVTAIDCRYIITIHGVQHCAASYVRSPSFVRYEYRGKSYVRAAKYVQSIRGEL
jgi:hypothetical protein